MVPTLSTDMDFSDGELEIERDGQWVYSNLPEPDPYWRATDSNGHEHAWAEGADHYPTLRLEYSEPYWCGDCDDEHTDSWYVCRICGAKVSPGTRSNSGPVWVGGPTIYRFNGEVISAEQAQEISDRYNQRRADEKREALRTSPMAVRAAQAMRDAGLSEEQVQRALDQMTRED